MRRSLLCLVLSISACGGDERDAEGRASEPLPSIVVEAAPRVVVPSIYDDEGNLRASDERVAGLTLPVGLTPNATDEERLHTYLTSEVPIRALLRYFGPRLTTGQVDSLPGGGAAYRNAVARDAVGAQVHMDVSILPVPGGRTLIEIREQEPAPTTPPPESESIENLTQAVQTAE